MIIVSEFSDSTSCKFQNTIFSSEKVQIVGNFYDVLNSYIPKIYKNKILINLNNFWKSYSQVYNNAYLKKKRLTDYQKCLTAYG